MVMAAAPCARVENESPCSSLTLHVTRYQPPLWWVLAIIFASLVALPEVHCGRSCGCSSSSVSEVWSLILRVLDAFWPQGATWWGQVISSPPGPSEGPSKTHLLPGGGGPQVHRAWSPVPPRLPRFATPRSVHQFAAVAAGAYPPRRPPNAWSPGAPAPPGPCYWLVASGTPFGWRGGCLA